MFISFGLFDLVLPAPFLRITYSSGTWWPNLAGWNHAAGFKICFLFSARLHFFFVYRENEVLKHQLRKYVSAVQMLKRDDADHSYEAQLYESKLVQVSELNRMYTAVPVL